MRKGMERLGREVSAARGQRMCLDKKQFQTSNEARDFSIRGQKRYDFVKQKPYRCGLCSKFHLATVREKKA